MRRICQPAEPNNLGNVNGHHKSFSKSFIACHENVRLTSGRLAMHLYLYDIAKQNML